MGKTEGRKVMENETTVASPVMEAQDILAKLAELAKQKQERIEYLRARRTDIDAELVLLGAKRARKARTEAKKPGRPKGSKNAPKSTEATA